MDKLDLIALKELLVMLDEYDIPHFQCGDLIVTRNAGKQESAVREAEFTSERAAGNPYQALFRGAAPKFRKGDDYAPASSLELLK